MIALDMSGESHPSELELDEPNPVPGPRLGGGSRLRMATPPAREARLTPQAEAWFAPPVALLPRAPRRVR